MAIVLAAALPARSLEVEVSVVSGGCREARIVAVPTALVIEPSGGVRKRLEWAVDAPGSVLIELEAGREWTVSAACPGMWAPETRLATGSEDPRIRIPLLPAGRLSGGLLSNGGSLEAGEVRYRVQPSRSEIPAWEAAEGACVVQGSRFDCDLPAGRVDLRLAVDGFAPHYAWDLEIPRGEALDLGAVALIEGASISGSVTTTPDPSRDDAPAPRAVVVVAPLVQGNPDERERRRLELHARRVLCEENGFFQVEGLAPGSYQLVASLAGYSPATLSPIDVDRGRELRLDRPLVLDPLVTLEAFLDPPHDVQGRPWRVRLLGDAQGAAGSTLHAEITLASATSGGYWSAADLPTGSYVVLVEDAAGSVWSEVPVEVAPSLGPLIIELPAVAVEGEVLRGGEPVAAEVVFGTTTRSPTLRMQSDSEGRFSGVLPHEGEWPLEIAFDDRPPQALDAVEVRRGADGVAWVSLRLPDTRLAGQVVAEDGTPAADALVLVIRESARASALEREAGIEHRRRREASVTTDRDGRFAIDGLLPAPLFVFAHDARRASSWVRVDLEEGAPKAPLRLVLRERSQVTGRVLSADGPVPGASVVGFTRGRLAPLDLFAQDVTGVEGRFALQVAAGTAMLDLVVAAPGHDLSLRRIPLAGGSLEIEVSRTGGRLILERLRPGTTLLHGGALVAIEALASLLFPLGRIELDDDQLEISGLEPGSYALCAVESAAGCATGFLGPGGELTLAGPGVDREEAGP